MTRDGAIAMVRKLRNIADGGAGAEEATTMRANAAKLQEKFGITESDLAVAAAEQRVAEEQKAEPEEGDVMGFLRNFERDMRVELLVEGRKAGRFADHPHAQKIAAAMGRRRAQQ